MRIFPTVYLDVKLANSVKDNVDNFEYFEIFENFGSQVLFLGPALDIGTTNFSTVFFLLPFSLFPLFSCSTGQQWKQCQAFSLPPHDRWNQILADHYQFLPNHWSLIVDQPLFLALTCELIIVLKTEWAGGGSRVKFVTLCLRQ